MGRTGTFLKPNHERYRAAANAQSANQGFHLLTKVPFHHSTRSVSRWRNQFDPILSRSGGWLPEDRAHGGMAAGQVPAVEHSSLLWIGLSVRSYGRMDGFLRFSSAVQGFSLHVVLPETLESKRSFSARQIAGDDPGRSFSLSGQAGKLSINGVGANWACSYLSIRIIPSKFRTNEILHGRCQDFHHE